MNKPWEPLSIMEISQRLQRQESVELTVGGGGEVGVADGGVADDGDRQADVLGAQDTAVAVGSATGTGQATMATSVYANNRHNLEESLADMIIDECMKRDSDRGPLPSDTSKSSDGKKRYTHKQYLVSKEWAPSHIPRYCRFQIGP